MFELYSVLFFQFFLLNDLYGVLLVKGPFQKEVATAIKNPFLMLVKVKNSKNS